MASAARLAARISTPLRTPRPLETRPACADSAARSTMAELPPRRALRSSAWAKLGPLHAHVGTRQRWALHKYAAAMQARNAAHVWDFSTVPAQDSTTPSHDLSQLCTPQQSLKMSCYAIVNVYGDAADLRLILLGAAAWSEPGCGSWS